MGTTNTDHYRALIERWSVRLQGRCTDEEFMVIAGDVGVLVGALRRLVKRLDVAEAETDRLREQVHLANIDVFTTEAELNDLRDAIRKGPGATP